MNNRVIAILVNYNNYKDTVVCVNSLLKQTVSFYKIVIVDNCSLDASYVKLINEYKNVEKIIVLKSEYNGGFSYGNNYGIKYAENNFEFDYFLLINNDTVADENMNYEFIKYYNENIKEKFAVLTGKIYYYDSPEKIWYAGDDIYKLKCSGYKKYRWTKDNKKNSIVRKITFVSGCLMFFKKELLKETGYLSEDYFMYFEDTDFSLKLIKKRIDAFFIPSVKIWHKVSTSSNKSNILENKNYYFQNRNRIIVIRKYYSFFDKLIAITYLIIKRIFTFIRGILKLKIEKVFSGFYEGMIYKIKE